MVDITEAQHAALHAMFAADLAPPALPDLAVVAATLHAMFPAEALAHQARTGGPDPKGTVIADQLAALADIERCCGDARPITGIPDFGWIPPMPVLRLQLTDLPAITAEYLRSRRETALSPACLGHARLAPADDGGAVCPTCEGECVIPACTDPACPCGLDPPCRERACPDCGGLGSV